MQRQGTCLDFKTHNSVIFVPSLLGEPFSHNLLPFLVLFHEQYVYIYLRSISVRRQVDKIWFSTLIILFFSGRAVPYFFDAHPSYISVSERELVSAKKKRS